MSNYGKNFEFRIAPHSKNRSGRHYNAEGSAIPIGAPVLLDSSGSNNTLGLSPVGLAAEGSNRPFAGEGGIVVYEYGPNAFAGYDDVLTTYSDLGDVPDAAACQMVNGDEVKVLLRNTTTFTFLNNRTYTGRTMVAGLTATPTIAVGDYLTPGDGSTAYWKETVTAAEAWLVVVSVDVARLELEARLLF